MSTLKRKLEGGIVDFIKDLPATVLEKYHGYQASEAKDRKFPGYVVKVDGEEEAFPGGAPRKVTLEILLMTQIDDNEEGEIPSDETRLRVREQHDEALAAIDTALDAPGAVAALQSALNAISGLHFYDITKTGEDQNFGERHFADTLSFEVVCQNCDG